MPGGAGYGDPSARAPELVAEDVRNGLYTLAEAGELYGVALDPATGEVMQAETERNRS
jgi:N-methylhydantoinase B